MVSARDDATVKARAAGARETRAHDFAEIFRSDGPGLWRTMYAVHGRTARPGRGRHGRGVRSWDRAHGHDPRSAPLVVPHAFRLAQDEVRMERRRSAAVEPPADQGPPEVAGLMRALRELSPNQRAAIVLRYEADLSVADVARRMGIAQPTVRVHIHRARARLRDLLGEEEIDDD